MEIDLSTLPGKRVRHKCEYPDCPLKGTVTRVFHMPDRTLAGEKSDYWAEVTWEGQGNLPHGYTQAVPLHKIQIIE